MLQNLYIYLWKHRSEKLSTSWCYLKKYSHYKWLITINLKLLVLNKLKNYYLCKLLLQLVISCIRIIIQTPIQILFLSICTFIFTIYIKVIELILYRLSHKQHYLLAASWRSVQGHILLYMCEILYIYLIEKWSCFKEKMFWNSY